MSTQPLYIHIVSANYIQYILHSRTQVAYCMCQVSIYIIESVCLFVRGKCQNYGTIDAKRSGITKNDPESVLCVLKSPVLVLLGRYRDISGFSLLLLILYYVVCAKNVVYPEALP